MITKQQLRTIEPLEHHESEILCYKANPLADLMVVATPQALLVRARVVRGSGIAGSEAIAAHFELAAETISELRKYLE